MITIMNIFNIIKIVARLLLLLVRLSLGSRLEIAEFPDGVHWFAP